MTSIFSIISICFIFKIFVISGSSVEIHQHHHGSPIYSKVMVALGYGDSKLSDVEIIDLQLPEVTCQKPPDFPIATSNAGGGLDFQEKPTVCGGSPNIETCHVYLNGSWKSSHSLNEGRTEYAMAKSPFHNGKLFLSGGYNSEDRISSTEVFTERGWQMSLPLPSTVAYHCMVALNSTSVMVIGGWQSDIISVGTYIFESVTNVWTRGPALTIPKFFHTCGLIRKDLDSQEQTAIVVGGREDYSPHSESVEVLDLGLGKWHRGPDLPLKICCSAMVQDPLGGAVLIGGDSNVGLLDKLYRLPHAGPGAAWEEMPQKLKKARMHHTAFLVPYDVATCN